MNCLFQSSDDAYNLDFTRLQTLEDALGAHVVYVTGTVNQALSLPNENRILKALIKGRLLLSAEEKKHIGRDRHRLDGFDCNCYFVFTDNTDNIVGLGRKVKAQPHLFCLLQAESHIDSVHEG